MHALPPSGLNTVIVNVDVAIIFLVRFVQPLLKKPRKKQKFFGTAVILVHNDEAIFLNVVKIIKRVGKYTKHPTFC